MLRFLWLTGGVLAMLGDAQGVVVHVTPEGHDDAIGSVAQPLKTLAKALQVVRKTPGQTAPRIVLHGGDYYDVSVELGPTDSGLTIQAAPGQRPVLYGGKPIDGWQPDAGQLWSAPLTQVDGAQWDFRMLVVNGRFCPRARLPREGHFTHLTQFNVPWTGTTGGGWQRKPTHEELTTMRYRPEDLGPWLDIRNAELTVFHSWDESVVGVASMDDDTHTLTLSNPCGHPPGAFGVSNYTLWNVREGMTQPGQWYLDRTRAKVVYWPMPGEDMATARVIAPTTQRIIRIHGPDGTPVREVTLRGLAISVTNTPLVAGGFGAGRFEGAVQLHGAHNCVLRDLEVFNVGGQGMKVYLCPGLTIEGCHVHHTGACGIKTTDGDCTVAGNHLHHVGLTYPSAIALWSSGSGKRGNLLAHNEIHDTPYTAIACGGDNHRVESNHLYRCMQKMRDGAAIYITFCKNIVMRYNFAHDIVFDGSNQAHAYYIDEQGENCLVESNVSLRAGSPFLSHWARKNTIRNNVFIHDGDIVLLFSRCEDYRVERNVVAAQGDILVSGPEAITALEGNLLFSGTGTYQGRKMDMYRSMGVTALTQGEGWLFADPQITEWEQGRVQFAPGSPALQLGIRPLDVTKAGPQRD